MERCFSLSFVSYLYFLMHPVFTSFADCGEKMMSCEIFRFLGMKNDEKPRHVPKFVKLS